MKPQLVGILLFIITILVYWAIAIKNRKEFWQAIIGENKSLDLPEIVVLMWLVIFPVIALADPFLGFVASNNLWWSLDAVLLFALTGKVGLEFIKKPK